MKSKEDKLQDLAIRLNEFAKTLDPYDYADQVDDEEAHIELIANNLSNLQMSLDYARQVREGIKIYAKIDLSYTIKTLVPLFLDLDKLSTQQIKKGLQELENEASELFIQLEELQKEIQDSLER